MRAEAGSAKPNRGASRPDRALLRVGQRRLFCKVSVAGPGQAGRSPAESACSALGLSPSLVGLGGADSAESLGGAQRAGGGNLDSTRHGSGSMLVVLSVAAVEPPRQGPRALSPRWRELTWHKGPALRPAPPRPQTCSRLRGGVVALLMDEILFIFRFDLAPPPLDTLNKRPARPRRSAPSPSREPSAAPAPAAPPLLFFTFSFPATQFSIEMQTLCQRSNTSARRSHDPARPGNAVYNRASDKTTRPSPYFSLRLQCRAGNADSASSHYGA